MTTQENPETFPAIVAPADAAAILSARSVGFELYVGTPTWRRKLSPEDLMGKQDPEDEAAPDPAFFFVAKSLLARGALKRVNARTRRFKSWINKNHRIPCSILRAGSMLVGVGSILEVDRAATKFMSEHEALVEEDVVARYPELIADAQARLGKHFKMTDYPSVAEIREKFAIRTNWLALDLPRALQEVDSELFKRERERSELEWRAAWGEIRETLRASFLGLIEKLAEKLGPSEDGKKMILRESTVVQVREFLDAFGNRNITSDEELSTLVDQARGLLNGVDVEQLRSIDIVRERVKEGMTAIQEQLGTMVEPAPRRRFARPKPGEDLG